MFLQIILWAALFAALFKTYRNAVAGESVSAILWLFVVILAAMVIGESGCGAAGCA